jgi:hypothetical protein
MTSPFPATTVPGLANIVSTQFAGRPTFEQVAQNTLAQAIKQTYPSLAVDLSKTRLVTQQARDDWTVEPLMARVLEHLALGTPLDIKDVAGRRCFLSQNMPHHLSPPDARLDMSVIETAIKELPWSVPFELQDALTSYWNADIDASPTTQAHKGTSRWRWLSDVLKNALHIHGLQQPELAPLAQEALEQIVRWPNRDLRLRRNSDAPVHAYSLATIVTHGAVNTVLPGEDVLLVHSRNGASVILLCRPGSPVQPFESLEAFNAHWGEYIASRYLVDDVTCQRNEITGDVFDTQAAMILDRQLADLKAVQLPAQIGLQNLATLYQELSDPARFLLDAPRATAPWTARLEPLLPDWLKQASLLDQTTFQRHSLALASAKKRNQGRTFLSGIVDIRAFAADALLTQMQANDDGATNAHPSPYQPDDVVLTFTVAAGYPGTAGIVEKRTMTLTELAINNLIFRPGGSVRISHRLGLSLAPWLTADFIMRRNGLIEQVDIGTNYPRYLQQRLLDDPAQVQERQRMFAEQLPAQLALEALEQLHDTKDSMTRQGLSLVEALFQSDAADRQLGGQPVMIRRLAFLREPHAQPDIVTNMFVIERKDVNIGPHLLYRPLYAPSLQSFASREALLDAIATPGSLQDSVLTWMADASRTVYSNGGFVEPHYIRFFQGDEYSPIKKPAPAALAIDGVDDPLQQWLHNDQLLLYLYGSNARALVAQADRDSVSNRESRWAVFLEGGNLLFNVLLVPLLRGPAMLTAWLLNLIASATHDIPALGSEDPVARELAAVDLLLNLSLLAIQFPTAAAPAAIPLSETTKAQALRSAVPRAIAEQWPVPSLPRVFEGRVGLPDEHSETAGDLLDLRFTNSHQRLTSAQRTRIQRLRVPRPASLPKPIASGPFMGLYVIDSLWFAKVEGDLFRASPELDGSVRIADPQDPKQSGPLLQSDAQGNWSLDLRLRLRGGMAPKRMVVQRLQNARKKAELQSEYAAFIAQQPEQVNAIDIAQAVMERAKDAPALTEEQRAAKRKIFDELVQKQTSAYQKLLDSAAERAQLQIAFTPATVASLMENIVNNARKSFVVVEMDREAFYKAQPEFTQRGPGLAEAVARNIQGYFRFLDELSNLCDRAIRWLELKDQCLDALLNLDNPAGPQAYERLTQGRSSEEQNVFGVKALQLVTLKILSLKPSDRGLIDNLEKVVDPLLEQVRSHSDQIMFNLAPKEEFDFLESLTERYGQGIDALRGMKAVNGDDFETFHFDRLLKLVEGLYEDASSKLAAKVKPEPKPRKRPPKRTNASAGHSQKKVIQTRNNGVLIGDLKPAGTALPIDVVELRSEYDDQLLTTYSRHGDVWDPIRVEGSVAPRPTRPAHVIKAAARKLLGQLEKLLRSADRYKTQCRFPQEIEEIMNNEANRFRQYSTEFEKALPPPERTAADQVLIDQLSDAISRLTAKGNTLRTELSLQLPPTDGNLRYLFEQNKIHVAALGPRKAMKGARQDFIQEYAINDRDGFTIWYAHFHYETVATPKADFTVAHLKTKEHRKQHYHSLLAKATSPYAVVNVHRGQIGKPLAELRFLPLVQ